MKSEAGVWEIYSAIQGEGLLVGERHVFLRTAGCNLDCRFCDTPAREAALDTCAVERTPGVRDFESVPNPLGWKEAVLSVARLFRGQPPARRVSFTGGEPLVWPGFVKCTAEALRAEGIGAVLETNGTLAGALSSVGDLFDWISADIKLPSSTGGEPLWEEHEEFLRVAPRAAVFVKVIITPGTTPDDMERAARTVGAVDRRIPIVLQPVSPARSVEGTASWDLLRVLESIANKEVDHVRIIPQVHRFLGER